MYVILWFVYGDVWTTYDDKIYTSLEQVQEKLNEIHHNPRYGGELFKLAKVKLI